MPQKVDRYAFSPAGADMDAGTMNLRRLDVSRQSCYSACFWAALFVVAGTLQAGETKPDTPPVAPPVRTDPVPPAKANNRDWPGIFHNLQSQDAALRDAAVTDFLNAIDPIAQQTKKPFYAKFKESFASKDVKAHDEAAKRIALIGQIVALNDKRYKPLLAALASADVKAQNEQLDFLFKTTEESLQTDHIRELIEQLNSDDKLVVDKSYSELKAFGGDAADELANALDEEKVAVKKMSAELLREMGPAAKEAVNSLIFKLKDADDKVGRKYAAMVLENLGADGVEAVDDLVLSLDDDDKALRRICANILKKMGKAYKEATPELIVYLTHDDKAVRNLASELLLALGSDAKAGVRDLIEVIDEPPLPAAPNQPAQAANAANANDVDSKIRAAKVLASIGPVAKEALLGLKKYSDDKDPDLKEAVKVALDKITEGKPIETLLPPPEKAPKPKDDKTTKNTGENF